MAADPRSTQPAPGEMLADEGTSRSTGALVRDVATGIQVIVRKEVELARRELRQGARDLGAAAGAGGAAGILGLFVVGFLGMALGRGLEEVLVPWAAWLIVAGVFLLLAGIAGAVAASKARNASIPPTRSQQSIRENAQWIRQQLRR